MKPIPGKEKEKEEPKEEVKLKPIPVKEKEKEEPKEVKPLKQKSAPTKEKKEEVRTFHFSHFFTYPWRGSYGSSV